MPITRDPSGRFRFEFDRIIPGRGRVRSRRRLPRAWNRQQAEDFDRDECARILADTAPAPAAAVGIEDALTVWLTERAPELKHGRRTAQELALIRWAYRGQPLTALADVCAKLTAHGRDSGWKPATIRNRIAYLRGACRWAWKHHGLGEHDPGERVVTPTVRNARQVYTGREGMLRMCRATQCRETRRLIRICFYSGMRMGEVFAARVDLHAGVFVLDDTKNSSPRHVPITPRMRVLARALPFRFARSTLEKRARAARRAAGLGHMTQHDLRHSSASEMVNGGVDLFVVGRVLGHKSTQSTARYAHLQTDTAAAAMAKIGGKRGGRGG